MDTIAVVVEEEPPPHVLRELDVDGDEDLLGMRTLVEMLDEPALHCDADDQHHGYRKQHR